MMKKSTTRIFYGGLIHALSLREVQALPNALLCVSEQGTIEWLVEEVQSSSLQEVLASKGYKLEEVDVIELAEGEFLLPGFVDTHTHAPQYPNVGSGGQYELLDWLQNVTFPREAKFANLRYAEKAYTEVVQRVLDQGTTTCCYYGSLHLEATKILANICASKGQRAFVGKCNMDRNAIPTYTEPSAEQSLQDTKDFIAHLESLQNNKIVQPILTPRFAIACTDELLSGLGQLAKNHPDMAIQTHISENAGEIVFTRKLFPNAKSYADVYDSFGLLRKKTILAHGVHLADDELELIKEREAGISHCPTSNLNLRSGIAKVGEMLDRGIKVGLGTDVSGGYASSILSTIRDASNVSKVLAFQAAANPNLVIPPVSSSGLASKQLPISTLLYLATVGGADLCGLASNIGNFIPGKEFDALLVDVRVGSLWFESGMALEGMLEKFMFCGDDRNITAVWVMNRLVGGAKFSGAA